MPGDGRACIWDVYASANVCIANPGVLSWTDTIIGNSAEYPVLFKLLGTNPEAFDKAVCSFLKAAALKRRYTRHGHNVRFC